LANLENVAEELAISGSGMGPTMKPDSSTNSLERALAILEFVAHKSGGLTNSEISAHFKIPTSSSSYILRRLEREGYLRRTADNGRYEMGLKIVALSHGALRDMGLRRIAEPILHRLSAQTRVSALIGVLERGSVMIVDKVEKPDLARIDMKKEAAAKPADQFTIAVDGSTLKLMWEDVQYSAAIAGKK